MSTKICTDCSVEKSVQDFYAKTPDRVEAVCKACKKRKRRDHYKDVVVKRPKRNVIEPAKVQDKKIPINPLKYEKAESKVSDEIWDKYYNRTLTDFEKIEIKSNVLAVFDLLLSYCVNKDFENEKSTKT